MARVLTINIDIFLEFWKEETYKRENVPCFKSYCGKLISVKNRYHSDVRLVFLYWFKANYSFRPASDQRPGSELVLFSISSYEKNVPSKARIYGYL